MRGVILWRAHGPPFMSTSHQHPDMLSEMFVPEWADGLA